MKRLTKQIVVRVEPELDAWLAMFSERNGRTKAQSVRFLLKGQMDAEVIAAQMAKR